MALVENYIVLSHLFVNKNMFLNWLMQFIFMHIYLHLYVLKSLLT